MTDQNRNEDQNDEGDSSTAGASTTSKSFSQKSKSKPADATAVVAAATDVVDGNSTRAENNNALKRAKQCASVALLHQDLTETSLEFYEKISQLLIRYVGIKPTE
ncbi:unnamed protein product [Rotaria sordida]|uniref:Uncharacterized protein n=1 Tax=Rotaria sordida TaxID=392033 RepID=A0A814SY34_9BILA|nr:unnamed protein product [Rotaria sordida]